MNETVRTLIEQEIDRQLNKCEDELAKLKRAVAP